MRFAGDTDKVSPFDISATVPKKALAINRNLTQERPNESDMVPREVERPKSIMKKKKTDENSINKYKIDINKINADIKNQEKIQPVIHVEPPSYDEISGIPSQTQSLTLLKNQFSPHNLPKQKGEF